ncbi:MAG: hypothetical protein K5656_05030 [Lachnospiraceae bacterium]|nr:hypothetical protein [Lachnospiraceae bacterium]
MAMSSLKISREEVEKQLEEKVKKGKLTEEKKEALLRNYDIKMEKLAKNGYPSVGEPTGFLTKTDWLVIGISVICLLLAVYSHNYALTYILAGELFIYSPIIMLRQMIKEKEVSKPVFFIIFELCGIGLLIYGIVLLFK